MRFYNDDIFSRCFFLIFELVFMVLMTITCITAWHDGVDNSTSYFGITSLYNSFNDFPKNVGLEIISSEITQVWAITNELLTESYSF